MDLTSILEATASPDTNTLMQAQRELEQAAANNMPMFMKALANALHNCGNSDVVRLAAGLQLKNCLTAKDHERKTALQQMWLSFPDTLREEIKTMVFQTLGTEPLKHKSAAQCVAYIASAELPMGQWSDLIQMLLLSVTNPSSTEAVKESSLEAIGYICEEIDPKYLASQANEILTAIVQGMRKEEQSNRVRLAATKALYNSLEFTKANFEKESERHFIMQVVCEATQCSENSVQVAALQNLVRIMSLYYQYMESYMGPALFAITLEAMKSEVDEIALQGIEFWSTVCDEESDLAIEAAEAHEQGRPPEEISRFYVKGAMQFLVPVLLLTLTKQEEYDDEDDWNPCKAAGVCLSLMAGCCEDDLVPYVIPFIKSNIGNVDWKFRDAAVLSLGSILEGPDPSVLSPFVSEISPLLIDLLEDSVVQVRDSAAWTIGRVCEQVPGAVINETYLLKLLQGLTKSLQGEPRVATNACWAFSSLAEAAHENAPCEDSETPATYCLSPSFEFIVTKLIETADRSDSNRGNLRSSAYEALMDVIKFSAKDVYPIIQKTTLVIIERLQHVLQLDSQVTTSSDKQQLADLESLLCATLQSLLRKVVKADAISIADTVMGALLLMFQSGTQNSGVLEDAVMTVSALVEVIGSEFLKYMTPFAPYLNATLKNYADHQVCLTAIGLVGDLGRALGSQIIPFCDSVMEILVQNLSNAEVHRSIKPPILALMGDLSLAIGPSFKNYLPVVLQILQQASQVQADKSDFELVSYMNELWDGCLDAYTGIVQGLKGEGSDTNVSAADLAIISPHVAYMVSFIEHIASDPDHSDNNIASCCGLLGDLSLAFNKQMLPLVQNKPIFNKLVQTGRKSHVKRTKLLASWAMKELKSLEQS